MTKWKLPEGRAPITDAELAALTRRLVGTSIDYKERYEAAVRDAEEAEAYAAELESRTETQATAARRLRRKLEILKLDASKARAQLFHDIHECLALLDIINPDA
jgi:hypothetical protein